ncbi:MAG: alpha/beta hydrolase [Beijerinckiaceae bacterium]|nr:alpha/beta hydrolase [Beijerinckiaceae bacterium]
MNFESSGSGRPVLALHGYCASLFSWRHLPSALPDRRVIRVDLAGHGGSPARADGRYGLADHAAQLADFIDRHKLDEFDLIGHSMGGGVALIMALDLAERRPHSIGRLILVASVALPQPLPLIMRLARAPWAGPVLPRIPAKFVVPNALRGAFHDRRRVTEEMIQNYAQNLATAEVRRALVETAHQIIPDDLPGLIARYHSLRLPTLLIWGKQDWIVPPAIGITLNTLVEDSKLLLIDECGHLPQEERPEIVMPAIAAFLAKTH